MINYLAPIVLLFFNITMGAQSDVTPKGQTGLEAGFGTLLTKGDNPNILYAGFSVLGQLDLGLAYTGVQGNSAVTIASGFHFGGETNDAGVSLNLGYTIFSEGEDYVVYGPGVYANMDAGAVTVVPSLNFEFATLEGAGFAGVFGLSVITNGKLAVAFRPAFAFGRDDKYLFLSLGLLRRWQS